MRGSSSVKIDIAKNSTMVYKMKDTFAMQILDVRTTHLKRSCRSVVPVKMRNGRQMHKNKSSFWMERILYTQGRQDSSTVQYAVCRIEEE